ncbi:interleukin-12 subunit beta-like [Polypterus senegalus]|uniref:interleukin-12 subunit beta-like n=1 Tax=Polypterus senegalus TaxID=55291 RepID=UPI001962B33B|nr:interleukin-12 subunit beta-like [Polypterus senegalus]
MIHILITGTLCVVVHAFNIPSKFVVGEFYKDVSLACDTQFMGTVTWKHNGGKIENSLYTRINKQNLTLKQLDSPSAGNYTCWGEGTLLDHTYLVLLEEEEQYNEEITDFVPCTVKTYSCSIICSWKPDDFQVARIQLEREKSKHISWALRDNDSPFQLNLSSNSSPFSEEQNPIILSVEEINAKYYRKRTWSFFIRDIVLPDPPKILNCTQDSNGLRLNIEPPSSWAKPHSYFPLAYEVEYELKHNGKTEISKRLLLPKSISRLRARSQDPYINSLWSHWTAWRDVRKRSNKKLANMLTCKEINHIDDNH